MIVTLRNEWLTVEIEDVGAQLASITSQDGTQYLWQGDPDIWPRRAPLLFPVIARLKDGQYTLDGETYTISSHGFCRDALFTVEQHSETSVSFHLSDSEETRAVYPFAFHLTVTYTLAPHGRCILKWGAMTASWLRWPRGRGWTITPFASPVWKPSSPIP